MHIFSKTLTCLTVAVGILLYAGHESFANSGLIDAKLESRYELKYKVSGVLPCDRQQLKGVSGKVNGYTVFDSHACSGNSCEFSVSTKSNAGPFVFFAKKSGQSCAAYPVNPAQIKQSASYKGIVKFGEPLLRSLGVNNSANVGIFDLSDNLNNNTQYGQIGGKGKIKNMFMIDISYPRQVSQDSISLYGRTVSFRY